MIYKNEILLSQVQFSYFCLNFSIMKISIDHNSAIPLYLQIENQLRNIIREPEYKKGKMLPNEVDLSKQLGISRNTLRQAINNLVTEGAKTVLPSVAHAKIRDRYYSSQPIGQLESQKLVEFHPGNESAGNRTDQL